MVWNLKLINQPIVPPPGDGVSYSAGWGEEEEEEEGEENNQECWKENDSWKQLEILPGQNNCRALFVLDHLGGNASNETVISAETQESRFTPAAQLKAN